MRQLVTVVDGTQVRLLLADGKRLTEVGKFMRPEAWDVADIATFGLDTIERMHLNNEEPAAPAKRAVKQLGQRGPGRPMGGSLIDLPHERILDYVREHPGTGSGGIAAALLPNVEHRRATKTVSNRIAYLVKLGRMRNTTGGVSGRRAQWIAVESGRRAQWIAVESGEAEGGLPDGQEAGGDDTAPLDSSGVGPL